MEALRVFALCVVVAALAPGVVHAAVLSLPSNYLGVQLATRSAGLAGDFYDSITLTGYVSSAVDSTINFNPADTTLGINRANGGDTFSARWTGYVRSDYNETYTFYTTSDDGVRLYVNNQLVVNSWVDQGPTEHSGTIALHAGQSYPITLEFYENGGGSVITLSWSSASVSKAIIPSGSLSHGLGTATLNASSAGLTNGSSLQSGLVALWTFDGPDVTDKVYDRSGQGNNGYVGDGVATSSMKTIGKLGQALKFNGSTSHIVGPSPSEPTGAVTIAAWVKLAAYSPWSSIVDRYWDDNNDCLSLGLDGSTGSNLMFMWNNAAPYNNRVVGDSALPLNEWVYVAASSDGSNVTFYVNGVSDGTRAVGAPCANGPLILGANFPGGDEYFNGSMDDVRVYSRALSAAEVRQLYLLGQ